MSPAPAGTLAQAPEVDWPATAVPPSLYLTRRWVATQEGGSTATPAHVTIGDPRAPEAVLPCYLIDGHEPPRFDNVPRVLLDVHAPRPLAAALPDDEAAGALAEAAAAMRAEGRLGYPALVATAPNAAMFGYACEHGVGADPARRRAVEAALLQAFDAEAERLGARTRAFWYLRPGEFPELAAALLAEGYAPALISADCHLDVGHRSFEEYLLSIPGSQRHAVRREIRRFEAAGGSVTVEDGAALDDELVALHVQMQEGFGQAADAEAVGALFGRLRAGFDPALRVFVARRGERRLGFVLGIAHDDILYLRQAGFDRDDAVPFAYFNTLFYAIVRHAIEHGLRSVEYGTETWDAKRRRGCSVTPLMAYIKSESEPPGQLARYLRHYDTAVRGYVAARGVPELATGAGR